MSGQTHYLTARFFIASNVNQTGIVEDIQQGLRLTKEDDRWLKGVEERSPEVLSLLVKDSN